MINNNYAIGDKGPAQQPDGFNPNSSGMVLVVVLILAAAAGGLATGLHFAGSSRIAQGRQEMRFEKAFFVAEAGIERAKSALRYNPTNLNAVLFGGVTNYGGGTFYVSVRTNGGTNNIVIIRSTGMVESARHSIEVEVRVIPFVPGQAASAIGIYGTNNDLELAGNATIDGRDWNVPATFGNGTGSLSGNITNPGVLYSSTSTVIETQGSSVIIGDPPKTNATGGVYNETYWNQFLAQIISSATIYTNPPGFLGTRDAPIITMMPLGDTTLNNINGAGILIVPGYAEIKVTGNFHYEGLVFIVGSGIITNIGAGEVEALGNSEIFGAVVCIGDNSEIEAKGTADIKYSTEALANLAKLPIPAQMDMISWREIKASSTN